MSPSSNPVVPHTYSALRKAVEAVVLGGRSEIDRAWVNTYHEAGRLITEHVLQSRERADYGAKVFIRLAADTGINRRTLHQCAQFYRCFPIVHHGSQLNWAHYRALCQVENEAKRADLLKRAIREGMTSLELVTEVRAANALEASLLDPDDSHEGTSVKMLTPKRGTPGICRVIDAGEGPVVDLGFACYLDLPAGDKFRTGDLVRLDRAGRISAAPEATKADLFTYEVTVLKVVDGDTLWVKIRLWSRQWVKQKLRLRDLDCPEMNTAAGQAAKRHVESLMSTATKVTISTTKPDKYDRYLADVFLSQSDGEVYLNNELLSHGHAVRKAAWEFSDWDGA